MLWLGKESPNLPPIPDAKIKFPTDILLSQLELKCFSTAPYVSRNAIVPVSNWFNEPWNSKEKVCNATVNLSILLCLLKVLSQAYSKNTRIDYTFKRVIFRLISKICQGEWVDKFSLNLILIVFLKSTALPTLTMPHLSHSVGNLTKEYRTSMTLN